MTFDVSECGLSYIERSLINILLFPFIIESHGVLGFWGGTKYWGVTKYWVVLSTGGTKYCGY